MAYTKAQKEKAIELYLECGKPSEVIRRLGYPSRTLLYGWHKEYQLNGGFKDWPRSKYSAEQRKAAVEYYLSHGCSITKTVKELGYPGMTTLCDWLKEDLEPIQRNRHCISGERLVRFKDKQKFQAVSDFVSGKYTVAEVAQQYGTTTKTIYNWRNKIFPQEKELIMPKKKLTDQEEKYKITELQEQIKFLEMQADELKKQNFRLQLQNDILEKAAEVLKKDQGITLDSLTNREKAMVIDALRDRYPLKILLTALHMAKSSYEYQRRALRAPDKYADYRVKIKTVFDENKGRYGYRRVNAILKKDNIVLSDKVVLRIMKEEDLKVYQPKRRKYSSYQGEISSAPENLVQRNFHADKPNKLWLTDITEFHIPPGKVYLSPIIDCLDGLPVAWTIGTSPNSELTNTMLDMAISTLSDDEKPIIHSDRGAHYRWPGWIERIEKAGLTRSMSKKGCSPDNSACEGFFGRLKNEFFYCRTWQDVSIEEFIKELNEYMIWYCEKRIKVSLGGMSPIEYRKSLGLTA